jgi:hypothetical protein
MEVMIIIGGEEANSQDNKSPSNNLFIGICVFTPIIASDLLATYDEPVYLEFYDLSM